MGTKPGHIKEKVRIAFRNGDFSKILTMWKENQKLLYNDFETSVIVALALFVRAGGMDDLLREDNSDIEAAHKIITDAIRRLEKGASVPVFCQEYAHALHALILYSLSGDFQKANKIIESAEKHSGDSPIWNYVRALILIKSGESENALSVAIKARRLAVKKEDEPAMIAIHCCLSMIYEYSNVSKALFHSNAAIRLLWRNPACPLLFFMNYFIAKGL